MVSRCFAVLLMVFLTAALHFGQAGPAFAQDGILSNFELEFIASLEDQTFKVGDTVTLDLPDVRNANRVEYTVAPDLPDGLSINRGTGHITGSPTTVQAPTPYTVTAQDAGGTVARQENGVSATMKWSHNAGAA